MLRIRKSQLHQLSAHRQGKFIARVRPLLRARHPERTALMGDDELTRIIKGGMATSRGYGIEIERDVERYLDLMFHLGFDFDRAVEWAHDILSRPDFTGRIRIDLLCAAHEGRIPEEGPFFHDASFPPR